MKNVEGTDFNFNRILRVTITGNSGSKVIEYCPMEDERLNPRMDVTIKCMPIVVNKHNKPAFSAKVVIYNPPSEVITLINKHATWPIGAKTQKAYYSGRCRVSIDAGYWNPDSSNHKEYNALGDLWLNSSAYYRKGVDNVLEMWCHELELADQDIQKMTKAVKAQRAGYTEAVYVEAREKNLVGTDKITWGMMLQTLIKTFAPSKAPLIKAIVPSETQQMSLMTTIPTESDRRGITKFFKINYIEQPEDSSNPENGMVWDGALEELANGGGSGNGVGTRGLVLNGATFNEKIQEMIDFFPEPIVIREDLNHTDGISRYYVWRIRRGDGTYSINSKKNIPTYVPPESSVVTIYNFQNMLQVPSVDGSGCFTAKMLFNPAIRPQKWLRLAWVDDFRLGSAISSYTKGVTTSASFANYYPTLQGGIYQAQVFGLTQKENGYLFNHDYRIGYVTHTLSTYSNSWYTEVKTLSILAGG